MKVGVPTEIKADEYRVALTPVGVRELTEHGHEVMVQAGAGEGSAIADADYEAQGARIVPDAEAVFARGRDDPEGEGAAARARSRCCARTTRSSPTCTSRPTPELTQGAVRVGRDLHRLRDRRGHATAGCRCSRR